MNHLQARQFPIANVPRVFRNTPYASRGITVAINPEKKNNKKIERKKLSWRELQNLDSNIVTRNEHSYECHISVSMKTFVHMQIVERIALRLYFSRFLLFILC